MLSLYLLIPLSLVLVGVACWFFFFAVDSGQLDNLDEIGKRMPDDED